MFDFIYKALEKIGYTEPLHPLMVHIPMGLVISALIFVLAARLLKKDFFSSRAYYRVLLLAFIFSFPAIFSGYTDWQYRYGGAWLLAIKIKLVLSGALLVLLGIGLIYHRKAEGESRAALAIFALSFVAAAGLGFFGGRLSYGARPTSAAATVVSFQAGEKLYAANCGACHSEGADVLASSRLAEFRSYLAFLRKPTLPGGGAGEMPAFPPETISDDQAMSLYHYLIMLYVGKVLHPPAKQPGS